MTSQKDIMNQANEQYGTGGSGGFFTFEKNGTYRLRVLTLCYPLATHFLGKGVKPAVCYGIDKGCPYHGESAPKDDKGEEKKPSVKFVGYVIDRRDGKVKLGELPYSVINAINDLQEDEEYAFDDFPMPYDIKVTVDKDASPANMYKTLGSPNRSELTEEEEQGLTDAMKKRTPEVYVEQRKEKARDGALGDASLEASANEYPTGEDTGADVPNPW